MKTKIGLVMMLALAFAMPEAMLIIARQVRAGQSRISTRPEGPCDIYAAVGCPCVAAHSTTRALYASYNGPLYQVVRQSDGETLDIGVVQPSDGDAGGYADAAAQDAFCADTYCWIATVYDQSGHRNDLTQAPRGGFSGPAMGGFNNAPVADMAPVTIMGHKAYGIFIAPGMGIRNDNPHGTAVDDQAEGQYWVVNGRHYNGGCCFDYGNAETDSRDDGNGTMETTYFGSATAWYHGPTPGPWIMTDQENNLVGCVTTDGTKNCNLPIITWRFVTAMADGEPHHWRTMGGDSQQGALSVMFDGPRVNSTYDPMRKQGAILLGNGGDNSNSSQGTFYEGAMTAAGTMPTQELNQLIQANIVAAGYGVPWLSLTPPSAVSAPPGLQTLPPGSAMETAVTFTNAAKTPVTGVELRVAVPEGWTSVVSGSAETSRIFADPVAPGALVSATFTVTSGPAAFNGDLVATASWMNSDGGTQSGRTAQKVRSVSPVKINEFAVAATSSFIELYNAGWDEIDISDWTVTQHPTQQPIFSSIRIPAGTKLAARGFYLLGLANSGLAVPAKKGDATIYVRNTTGMKVGDAVEIDSGSAVEIRRITGLGTAAGTSTTVWQPLPEGPILTIPVGSTNVPVTSVSGFTVGQKIGIGHGATYPAVANAVEQYEVVTVTTVGKAGAQTYLSADAKAADTAIKVRSAGSVSAGDKITLDIDSVGHGTEIVTVKSINSTTLTLTAPLAFNHAANIPVSIHGTGIGFQPATAFAHSSNEPVLPLGTGLALDQPLDSDHEINAVVRDSAVTTAGYQGTPPPSQWFGGPALASNAGSMVLRDAAGMVADSLNYGSLVDPWAAEGYQGTSPGSGCFAPAPGTSSNKSTGRVRDGGDADSNCHDFAVQTAPAQSALSLADGAMIGGGDPTPGASNEYQAEP
jgi:non-reducing end alpha-L-arabinofuranosidase